MPTAELGLAVDPVNGPDLATRLHAAVDAVLGRYDCEHDLARDDLEVLECMSEVETSVLDDPPQIGQLLQIQRAPGRPGVEVRTLPGLTTWLAVIDSAAVVLPKRDDRAGPERTVSRSPAVLAVANWAFHHARPAPAANGGVLAHLSQLEVLILRCLSAGLKDEQAARRLGISVRTYRRRVTALCDQLHASSRFEAGVAAAKRGLV